MLLDGLPKRCAVTLTFTVLLFNILIFQTATENRHVSLQQTKVCFIFIKAHPQSDYVNHSTFLF